MPIHKLDPQQLKLIKELVQRYDSSYEAGTSLSMSSLLEEVPGDDTALRRALLVELISIDLRRRSQSALNSEKAGGQYRKRDQIPRRMEYHEIPKSKIM